jgi:glycerophosphoryl diester phosphodiesterase
MIKLTFVKFLRKIIVFNFGNNMKTKIIAHRGSSFYASENTLAAFKLAIKENAAGIEGDFRYTKDGYIVCIHDESSLRTSGVDLKIEESTLKEIRELEVGSWKDKKWKDEKIPLLTEILMLLPENRKFYIEIKSDVKIIPYLKEILKATTTVIENIHFISFDKEVIKQSKKEIPQYKAFWLTDFNKENKENLTAVEILKVLKDIKADGVDCKATANVDEEFVSIMRNAGMELHCWTVDDVETAKCFVELGFDSITTNKPALLLQHLN